MKLIVCLDDNGGMAFNHRRQTKDIKQRQHMNLRFAEKTIKMDSYSEKLYRKDLSYVNLNVDDDLFINNKNCDYLLVERDDPKVLIDEADEICIYRWNRSYPDDVLFPLEKLNRYELIENEEFVGNSHESISFEVYKRK